MLGRLLTPFAVGVISFIVACNADRGIVSDETLSIDGSISAAAIGAAETATITYRLRNDGRLSRTVAPARCGRADLRIDDERGANVFPGSTAFICSLSASPPDTLAPGEELTRTFTVSGLAGSSSVRLPAGRYTAEAEFVVGLLPLDRYYQLRSEGVSFEVTP